MRRLIDRALTYTLAAFLLAGALGVALVLYLHMAWRMWRDRRAVLTNQPTPAARDWYVGMSDQPWDRPVLPIIHVPGRDDGEIVENLLRDRMAA
jgi:hypothetical protein